MNKTNKKTLVPRLRFPEFRDSEYWEVNQLGKIAEFYKGKGISKSDVKADGTQPCVRYGELYTIYGEVIEKVLSKTNISPKELFLSHKGDVIIPASGETKIDIVKATCVMADNIALGSDLNVIRSNHNGVFISYYLNGTIRHEIAKVAQGDTVVHLYKSNLEKIDLALPGKQEQQKIADCLSSLDALIAAQADKIEALKTHKKGLMQQLFPREGETVPRLRFPEFQDSGEWDADAVGNLVELLSGYAFKSEYFSDQQGRKLLTPKNFTKNGFGCFNIENTKLTTESCDRRYICKNGDLLLLLTDLTPSCELLGKPLLLTQDDGEVLLNQRIVKVTPVSSVKTSFLQYFFLTDGFRKRIIATATGSTVRHSSNKIIESTEILFPCLFEQQKIVECLSSLDAMIAAQAEKLDALKTHKKGLMQQLFPRLESMDV